MPGDGYSFFLRRRASGMEIFTPVFGAVFDLSHEAEYLHWHFFQMSVPNVIVILLMIVVFVAAIAIPFPKRERTP